MAKMKFAVVALTSGILALSGEFARCASLTTGPLDPATHDSIEGGVRQMMSRIPSDLSRYGPTAWLRYFDDDPRFLMAADGKLQFDGIASARSFLSTFSKSISHVELAWTSVKVDPLEPGMASVAASYSEVLTDTQGHANRPHGYFTGLVLQTPMGWKLRWAHWSSLPATN